MNSNVEKSFRKLEAQRKQLLTELQSLNETQISFSSGDGVWSINQVLMHLLQAEKGTLQYMQKKNQAVTLPRAGLGASFRSKMLTAVLRSPFRYKAPKRIGEPPKSASRSDILQTWDETREQLYRFLRGLPNERIKSAIFYHPRGGYFNVFHTLQFFNEHIKHHKKQIRRIQNAQHFPR